jgi:transketolase
MNNKMDELSVNTIRTLAMDAVQRANSGHPGTPVARMETFVASAPLKELQKKFGFTVENIVEAAKQQLAQSR